MDERHGEKRDALARDWPSCFARIDPAIRLFPLPNVPDVASATFSDLPFGALVLSNGDDHGASPERDRTEELLFGLARKKSVPVLGFCRGFQVVNLFLGGSLAMDVAAATGELHAGVRHPVRIEGELFRTMAGGGELKVNSYHRQGVLNGALAPGLAPIASTPGCVEAYHHEREPLLALQWHPEREDPAAAFDRALITRFLKEGAFWAREGGQCSA